MAILEDNIADEKQDELILRGIQPKRQGCYKFFKAMRLSGILLLGLSLIAFITTKFPTMFIFSRMKLFRLGILATAGFGVICLFLAFVDKALFLRKAPFDDWVFEIAQKRLGTEIIFYDSKHIYIDYDRGGKEVDKKDFVSEMSDKSVHYSYFYVKTDIDKGYIVVECKERQPIPDRASFSPDDDKFWNIIPMGLTINNTTQKISPIGWYLNDINKNDELYPTVPSTSILICGGTGCFDGQTPVLMHDTLVH